MGTEKLSTYKSTHYENMFIYAIEKHREVHPFLEYYMSLQFYVYRDKDNYEQALLVINVKND